MKCNRITMRDAAMLVFLGGMVVLTSGAVQFGGRMQARTLMCATNLRFIGSAMSTYADTYGGRLPQLEYNTGQSNETQQHPNWAFRAAGQTQTVGMPWEMTINLGCLYRASLIKNPGTFYCPADSRWVDAMASYATGGQWGDKVPSLPVNDPFITDNPDPAQRPSPNIACLRLNIAYWPQSRNLIMNSSRLAQIQRMDLYEVGYPDIAYKAVDLDPGKAYVSDNGRHGISGSPAAGEESKGQNALFGDGHVAFGKPPKDPYGTTYRIRQENEPVMMVDGASNRTNRYFFYLQP